MAWTLRTIFFTASLLLAKLPMLSGSFVQAQSVDTRIGKIDLQAGHPSKASVERLFDEMDFQRATQAFIWALPAVGFLSERGPMVVDVPAGATAGGLLDIWQGPISDTGHTGPDRGGERQVPDRFAWLGHS